MLISTPEFNLKEHCPTQVEDLTPFSSAVSFLPPTLLAGRSMNDAWRDIKLVSFTVFIYIVFCSPARHGIFCCPSSFTVRVLSLEKGSWPQSLAALANGVSGRCPPVIIFSSLFSLLVLLPAWRGCSPPPVFVLLLYFFVLFLSSCCPFVDTILAAAGSQSADLVLSSRLLLLLLLSALLILLPLSSSCFSVVPFLSFCFLSFCSRHTFIATVYPR